MKDFEKCIDDAHDFRASLTKLTQSDPDHLSRELSIRVSKGDDGKGTGYYIGGFHMNDPLMQAPIERAFQKKLRSCISR